MADNENDPERPRCKICNGEDLTFFAHSAKCRNCGVLLFWPYPRSDDEILAAGETKAWPVENPIAWYSASSFLNHSNFTSMLRFACEGVSCDAKLDVLDYGGGGGQFALVCRSHFPRAEVYITDIFDEALLDEWAPMNRQIPFSKFSADPTKFDIIFLNDVFEHVSDPAVVLSQLVAKLKPEGRIFIDTPKQFWIYPFAKAVSSTLYTKVLRGTVTIYHLQIWSRKAFNMITARSGLSIVRYCETSEYTMPPNFYLDNMGIKNPLMRFLGRLFYTNAKYLAKNKIMCVLARN